MTVSFTQTYEKPGRERERIELLKAYFLDRKLHEFKNHFDLNIYSFHNCPQTTINIFRKYNRVKNTEIMVFRDINYPSIVAELKSYLKKIGAKTFFFSQDDTFSDDNKDLDTKELYEYVKNQSSNFMLNLAKKPDHIDNRLISDEVKKSFKIYHIDSQKHGEATGWPMSDEPYICSADMLDLIYDKLYIKEKNIWDAEWYLQKKFSKVTIPRWITDRVLFRNYNLFGVTIKNKDIDRKSLEIKGFL